MRPEHEAEIRKQCEEEVYKEMLAKSDESFIHRSSRLLAKERINVEALVEALSDVADMKEYDQDDAHRLRYIASQALKTYRQH